MLKLDAFVYDAQKPLLFTSGTFLALFTLFLIGLIALPIAAGPTTVERRATLVKLAYLYAFSLFFYYKSSGWFVGLLMLMTLADFYLARLIAHTPKLLVRRVCLGVSLCTSLGLLAYFKYANFFIDTAGDLFGLRSGHFDVVLPVGISFYTFQSVGYLVDVYRGRIAPANSLLHYALYLAFFPQLIAGPIVRADALLSQFERVQGPNADDVRDGLYRVVLGLVKKCLIADYLAGYCDTVFVDYRALTGSEVVLGFYAYGLQIYFDFSGYSDMAVGLARLLGFSLPENFRAPYSARSLSEFWQRWHITLSTWLRDYLYVPLGGNRQGPRRRDANVVITMLLGGLWHGAAWHFVLWGLLHGVGLVLDKRWRDLGLSCPPWVSRLATLHFVLFGWILFRAPSLDDFWNVLARASELRASELFVVLGARSDVVALTLLGWALVFSPAALGRCAGELARRTPVWAQALAAVIVTQLLLEVSDAAPTPFIYFQF